MTIPGSCLPRLDPVAVRATNDALVASNLRLDGGDGLERGDVRGFPLHVVDVERRRMRVVSAVDAPRRDLEVRDPRLDSPSASVLYRVDTLSVAVLREPSLPPGASLGGCRLRAGGARSLSADRGAVLRGRSLRHERLSALHAGQLGGGRVLPGRHTSMIAAHDRYPCKPDVFEVTYEPVAVIDCPDHRPVQHRDGKPPWCKTCGLTAYGVEPVGMLGDA